MWSSAPYVVDDAVQQQLADIPPEHLYPVAIFKLVAMCLFSFGLYELLWFYRNWWRIRARTGRRVSPFWRMFFAPFWAFSMFEDVMEEAHTAGVSFGWSSVFLGICFFALSITWRFPRPFGLISFLAFLPLVPVQRTINKIARRRGIRVDDDLGPWHLALFLVGSIALVLAVIGNFLPEPPQ